MAKVRAALERIRDPSVQTALSEAAYTHVRPVLKESLVNCPYALSNDEADCLESFGITVNPYANQTHTHAACKVIENRMLEIVGMHLPKHSCTMLFLKRSKLRYMRRAAILKDIFLNKDVEPKDLFRYDRDTIRSRLQDIDTKIAYMSDTLHFMSRREIVQLFEDSPKLETLLATVVLPVEALHKRTSLYPSLYSINYSAKGFEYIPGNHGGGSYFHPYTTLEWLKVRMIKAEDFHKLSPGFTLTFQLVESLGANHLFIIQKAKLLTPQMRTFCRDSLVTLPQIFCPVAMNANRPLSKTKAMQMLLYCKSVKQVTERDIYAKIRQIIPTSELELYDPDEIVHLANYFFFVSNLDSVTCYEDLLSSDIWMRLTRPLRTAVRKFVEFFKGKQDFDKLLIALKWQPFSYSLEPVDFTAYFVSRRVRTLAKMEDISWHQAADLARRLESEPDLLSWEDLCSKPIADPLANVSIPPSARFTSPAISESRVTDISPTKLTNVLVESILHPAISNHLTIAESLNPKFCGWTRGDFHHMIVNQPSDRLKGCRSWFYTTSPDVDLMLENLLLTPIPWESRLSDILLTLNTLANACCIQILDCSAASAWVDWSVQPIKTFPVAFVGMGETTLTFDDDSTLLLKEGEFVLFPPEWLIQHKYQIKTASNLHLCATFLVLDTTLLGETLANNCIEPEPLRPTTSRKSCQSTPPVNTSGTDPLPGVQVATPIAETEVLSCRPKLQDAPKFTKVLTAAETSDSATDSLPWASWVNLLQKHGFKGNQQQIAQDGQLIIPISDIRKLPHIPFPEEVPETLRETLKNIKRFPVEITLQHKRAGSYASDIKNNRTGKLLSQMDNKWKAAFAYKLQQEDKKVCGTIIHGCGGSGKSFAIQEWMRSLKEDQSAVTVVTPTVLLRNDWQTKLPILPADVFKTFEKAVIQPCNPILVFDDYTKLPPGLIESVVMHHQNVVFIILTGDNRQSVYHETNPEAYIAALPEAVEIFSPYCEFYLNATHRNVKDLANKLGVYSEREGKLKVNFASHHLKASRIPMLVPSTMKRNAMFDMGHHSMTYAGCQGLTAPKIQILLDNHTQFCSERVLYTCLSRAVDTIHFINTGPTTGDYWAKLGSTPYLKAFIDTYRDEKTETYNSQPASAEPTEPEAPATHFPTAPKPLLEPLVEKLTDKEAREIFSPAFGHSNAIQTEDPVVQLFQHQQAKDETLYWATIDTRLAISTPEENLREFNMKHDIGDILFMNYAKLMCLPPEPVPFEERLWKISADEVRNTYISKPIGNLVNAAARQSPDFPKNKIALFLKSQWVKKTEKLGTLKVKPGQTIASFMQETVMLYGTMARYLRKMRRRFQPDNIFINCETTPEDLDKFIKSQWDFSRPAHTNDFTAFDQSQDGAMLQFEVIKAKFFNIPAEIIEGYIHIKLNAAIFLGTLGIMRLSGEGPTFDANTECSIAYNATRFHITADTAQVYAGDDMALDRVSIEKDSFNRLEKQLKLTSKPMFPKQVKGDYAEFCGWVMTPAGIIKHSLKMHASIQLQKKINNIKESARSYALDLRYAYKLGDELQEHLNEVEADYHQQSVRDMHLLHQQDVLNRGSVSPPHVFEKTTNANTAGSSKTHKRNELKKKKQTRIAEILPSPDDTGLSSLPFRLF
nr:186K protein [Narcissus mosaic virus]